MNDIIDVYEPVYTSTNYAFPILIILLTILVSSSVIFLILKLKKRKTVVLTPEENYKNCLESLGNVNKEKESLKSSDYASKINFIYKSYLTTLLNYDFTALTTDELIERLGSLEIPQIGKIEDYFKNYLDPALYAGISFNSDIKDEVIKNCVESITFLYNREETESV